ncbi:lipid-A-disaccharide synthase [Natronocella acetinitrilica]|uniref:Lipid-A-disaccharide synthase n=2 Tax=Natronocella acetinitrilica TaxID=414046 RepID=A0AAE3KCW3_9GAMM|nr:lipid-A-disaccharide synthase [Natronocella acetinitrilica]
MPERRSLRVGIIAGEVSGDYLGAGLMRELQALEPEIQFEGIGGERMLEQGMTSHHPMESLSVMGLFEVLKHLPGLLRIRADLVQRFLQNPPDVFIGIDAPDFNLGVESRLKAAGIPTVHYVSPTVWAWRQGRVKTIRRAVDLLLSIFPFEVEFFQRHAVPVTFVGHPLADEIPLEPDQIAARQALEIVVEPDGMLVALLPGSRMSEVTKLGPVFLQTARWLQERQPGLVFVIPCATDRIRQAMEEQLAAEPGLDNVHLYRGQSRLCMEASNAVLLASGTATLEAMLYKRPMVAAYRVSGMTAWLARRLVKVPHFAMPNLIAGRHLIEEFAQEQAVPEQLGPAMLRLLEQSETRADLRQAFADMHRQLRLDASRQAALAVHQLLLSARKLPA